MYIIILDNKKKLHKYVNSLSQSEIERSRFFIISDGGDISKKDLPKKADYTKMNLLIPPASCPISSPVLSKTRNVKSPFPDSIPSMISSRSFLACCAGRTIVFLTTAHIIMIISALTNISA